MCGVPMMILRLGLGLFLGFSFLSAATAADPAFLSKHGAWTAHVKADSGRKTCFAWTMPTKSKGNYQSRGDVLAFVTVYKPAPEGDDYYAGGQISVVAGYRYKPDGTVVATIARKKYELFSDDDTAWAIGADGDKTLIAAMKAGSTMVVNGSSWRPTKTTDTYSLKGFTAAYNAIRAACK